MQGLSRVEKEENVCFSNLNPTYKKKKKEFLGLSSTNHQNSHSQLKNWQLCIITTKFNRCLKIRESTMKNKKYTMGDACRAVSTIGMKWFHWITCKKCPALKFLCYNTEDKEGKHHWLHKSVHNPYGSREANTDSMTSTLKRNLKTASLNTSQKPGVFSKAMQF